MVAFLFERKIITVFFPCLICELIGWSPLFTWSNDFHYGMLTHIMWGMVYASHIMLTSLKRQQLITLCSMVLFQLIMSIDCWSCNGGETILFILYKYIIIIIHCCIIFTFLPGRRIITRLGNVASNFRVVITRYGFNVGFWYTKIITSKK